MSIDEYELLESMRKEVDLCNKKRKVRCCSACCRYLYCDVNRNYKELKNETKNKKIQ